MDANFSLRTSGFWSLGAFSTFARDWSSREALDDDEIDRSSPPGRAAWLDNRVESQDQLRLLSRLHSSVNAHSTPLLPRDRFPDNCQPTKDVLQQTIVYGEHRRSVPTSKPVIVSSSCSLVRLKARWWFDLADSSVVSRAGLPGPGLSALDFTTREEGVDGLDEFDWVWENEKLKPGLVLALEATELLGLTTRWCKPPVAWLDFRWSAGLRLTPRKAGLLGVVINPCIGLGKAGLDFLPYSKRAGLDKEFFTFISLVWLLKGSPK